MKNILITLIVGFPLFFWGCKKQNSDSNTSPTRFTSKMGGVRIWHYLFHGATNGWGFGTSTPFSNTFTDTFALSILNETTIELPSNAKLGTENTLFYYFMYDTVANSIYYYANGVTSSTFAELTAIIYYPKGDSITISGTYYGLHGWAEQTFRTP